jgi:hypothetical protein
VERIKSIFRVKNESNQKPARRSSQDVNIHINGEEPQTTLSTFLQMRDGGEKFNFANCKWRSFATVIPTAPNTKHQTPNI